MATVYLPLGSAAASGTIYKTIVYQGVTVRVYTLPSDPRTTAQVDQRHIFYDWTKTLKSLGPWGKAALKTVLGSRWYTLFFKYGTTDQNGQTAYFQSQWDGFTTMQQEAWDAAAPFQATYNRPGYIFWMLSQQMFYLFDGWPEYWLMPEPFFSPVADLVTWWGKTLAGVVTHGDYEDTDAAFSYGGSGSPGWSLISAGGASGGSYHRAANGTNAVVELFWYGAQITVRYTSLMGGCAAFFQADGASDLEFTQSAASTSYQLLFVGPTVQVGLHHLTLMGGVGTYLTFDGVIVRGSAPKTTVKEKPGLGGALPSGCVVPFAGVAVPAGWLAADGASLQRAAYPSLFAVLGVSFGAVDGDTFNLPDLRGRVPVGAGAGAGLSARSVGDVFGSETHVLVVDEMPEHTHTQDAHNHTQNAHTHIQNTHNHTQNAHNHTYGVNVAGGSSLGAVSGVASQAGVNTSSVTATNQAATATNQDATATNQTATATNQNTGGDGEHNNLQPSSVLMYIIKT